ncbi:hypothetical protein Tco_0254964 [Tanacetum coccineum]
MSVRQSVSDPDPLSYAEPQPIPDQDIAQSSKGTVSEIPTEGVATMEVNIQFSVESPESGRSTSAPSIVGSLSGIYQPGWGVTNDYCLDTTEACQDMVDHTVLPGYFSELRHLPNTKFFAQYNVNLARQVALGSQLRLRFEQEVRQLKKARAQVARRNERIQVREEEIKRLGKEVESLKVVETEVHGLREERIKAEFEEFKKYKDNKVEQRCAEMDARLDKLSVDIDEELYPHILTAIAGRHWVIRACQREDAPQWIRDLRPSSSQLKIPIYPEVRAPEDPWAVKEEVPLEDAIAANISRAEKIKKCRVVCGTHGIGSAHHAMSDGIHVSVPIVVPQGLAILLTDAGTQAQRSKDEASPRLLRSKSLPPMYNLDWP